jgi:Domain of unknown function (DUF222)
MLVIEQTFEYNGSMQFGDSTTDEHDQRSPLDEALGDAEQALTTMISLLEAGDLDPLSNEQTKVGTLQREGVVSTEKVQIVERAMNKLTRPSLDSQAVQTAEQLLTEHAVILAPAELKRFAQAVVNAADADGPDPIDEQLRQDRRYLELKQRRDGMWHLNGKLTSTVGAQLNAILDPLTKPRSTAIEDEAGNVTEIPDGRPYVQRLHARRRLRPAAQKRRPTIGRRSPSIRCGHHRSR